MAAVFSNPIIKIFEHSSIADGATFSDDWEFDDDYVIKYIFIKADGAATTKSTITIRLDNVPLTKDKALCNTFGTNPENAIELNISVKKSQKIDYEGTNNEGATKDFTIELVMEKA